MKKDAYYFPHFCNARHDRKLKRVQKELGIEGYGIYFMLLEVLRDQDGFKYPLEDIDLLSDEFGTSEQKANAVICNYKLFELDEDNMFFSVKLNEYMTPYLTMKEQRRQAGIKSGEARRKKALSNSRSTGVQRELKENEQSKVKKSKVYSDEIKNFTGSFQDHVLKSHNNKAPKITESLLQNCNDTIEKLIRLDNFELNYIIDSLRWAVKDDFWNAQVLSLASLRKKSNNGLTKFQNIANAYDNSLPEQPKEKKYVI